MKTTKILASLTIAQAILESGWGLSGLTKRSNNLFGIKGKGVASKTFEYINGKRVDITDNFKAYPDWETSVADHSGLFLRLPVRVFQRVPPEFLPSFYLPVRERVLQQPLFQLLSLPAPIRSLQQEVSIP